MRVQAELDETKVILHKTIESVLERGDKLDSLVERSDALSAQSKLFYKTAKKQVILQISRPVYLCLEFVLSCYVGSVAIWDRWALVDIIGVVHLKYPSCILKIMPDFFLL